MSTLKINNRRLTHVHDYFPATHRTVHGTALALTALFFVVLSASLAFAP